MLRNTSLLVIAVAATQCGSTDCGGGIIRDSGFDLWCGDQLCTWKIARGDVRQVVTWHEGDDGVELLGADSAIFQHTPVEAADGSCIEFELVADVDAGVELRFQVDVWGDGTIELDERIPSADWRPLSYQFGIDGDYQGVTFWITKQSAGHAVVAQLAAQTCGAGDPTTRVTAGPAPAGAACGFPDQCASGLCEPVQLGLDDPTTCGACEAGAACPNAGDVCGLAPPLSFTLYASTACVPAASKPLGAQCTVNAECADGFCVFGVCSSCFDTTCAGAELCGTSANVPYEQGSMFDYPAPVVCAPGQSQRAAGEPCSTNSDCASATCVGPERRVCRDGRACAYDYDCPVITDLDHGRCATVGVIGGTCQ